MFYGRSGKNRGISGENGAVTVFLTLVFSLVFSMTLVSLEAARSAAARAFSQMLTAAAAESVAADYYGPLFDEYHLFGFDTGYGEMAGDVTRLADDISSRITDNIWSLGIRECSVTDSEPYLDAEADVFTAQAAKYEMIGAAGGVLSVLGEKLGLVSKQDQSAKVLQKKLDAESRFAKLDELTLELVKHVDGVNCVITDSRGTKYKPEKRFAKRLFTGSMSAQTMRMRNLDGFTRLSSQYCDAISCLEKLSAAAVGYAQSVQNVELLTQQLAQIEDPQTAMSLQKVLGEQMKVTDKYRSECVKLSDEIKEACSDSEQKTRDALDCMERIRSARDVAAPSVGEYEDILADSTGSISEEELSRHNASLNGMKQYLKGDMTALGVSFDPARDNLEENLRLLQNSGYAIKLRFMPMGAEEAFEWADGISKLKTVLSGITYDRLCFNYACFSAKKEDTGLDPEFCAGLADSIRKGLLGLVLSDDVQISENTLPTELLPSSCAEPAADESGAESARTGDAYNGAEKMSHIIGSSELDEVSDIDGESVKEAENADNTADIGSDNKALMKALAILYMHDHFAYYTDLTLADDTVLKYEQEYIACGKDNDRDNLSDFLSRLLLLRLTSAILYVMSDTETSSKAEAAAMLTVGFTGLPYLIKAVQYLILLVWAYEQAVIEVAALTMGKKIHAVTCREEFCLDIKELVSFSSEMVREKAEKLVEPAQGIGYGEYLMIFMMLNRHGTACYRAMDLIQENLRYEYDEAFLLSNCIDRFTAKAVFMADYMFTGIGGYEVGAEHTVKY